MKVVIAGAGEVGFHIAQKLSEESQDVFLIEKDSEKVKQIIESLDVQAILGSGTSPAILKSAGIADADMLIAATDSDEVNIIACLLARHINPHILKVARVRNREYLEEKDLFNKDLLGVDQIINPEAALVDTIRNLMLVPGASDVVDFENGRVKLIGMTIKPDSPIAGRKLQSLKELKGKFIAGAIVRGEKVIIPHGEDTIETKDLVYFVLGSEEIPELLNLFDMKEKALKTVIIVGAGETGAALAGVLEQTNLNVKIIEKDSERCTELAEKLEKAIIINGDGTDRDLLFEENVPNADLIVAITGDEEHNVLISLLAKELGTKRNITRINKLSYIPLVSAIGIDTVVSSRLSAIRAILRYIRRGKVLSVAPLKGEHAEAIEAEALPTSDLVNEPLAKVKLPKGAIVGAILRNDEIIIPHGDSLIKPGDRLIIFVLRNAVSKLEKLLTVKLDFF